MIQKEENSPESFRREENLVTLRKKAGLTQEGLAARVGVTHHTIRNWEKNRSNARLTIPQFKALYKALNCKEIDDLPDSLADDSCDF
jgi:transcriptional regulator with XRE-family HTH domain